MWAGQATFSYNRYLAKKHFMKKALLFLFFPLFLSSCATVITKKEYKLRVYSNNPGARALINDSVYALPARVNVARSKEDLAVKLITDSLTRDITVKSSPNPSFVYGNLLFLQAAPLGYLIDFNTHKRFYYGKKIVLNDNDTSAVLRPRILRRYHDFVTRRQVTHKGQVNLVLSLPWASNYYFQPKGYGEKVKTGFFGMAAGIEYYYKNNTFIKLNGSATMDYFFPIPVPTYGHDDFETFYAFNVSLTNNHRIGRLSVGYGPAFTSNGWLWSDPEGEDPNPVSYTTNRVERVNRSLGLSSTVHFRLTDAFHVGLIYNPSFYTVRPETAFNYEHVISLDMQWKIRLK